MINTDSNENIVHIINRDKFTLGYIRFMQHYFKQYNQRFIIYFGGNESEYKEDTDIILLKKKSDLVYEENVKQILFKADKIIVTGIFMSIQNLLVRYNDDILAKTYFQFWGGDFYIYRNRSITGLRSLKLIAYDKRNLVYCIKHCAGIINLIATDWNEFYKIFPYDVKHFVAPMCGDPNALIDYERFRRQNNVDSEKKPLRILVGNSATKSNYHMDVFLKLSKFTDENIIVIAPLSYGDKDDYRNTVINKGTSLFGDKFYPITEYMEKEDYVSLLNSCDIGIFNNDRQQGMGNINIMLSLGKKIYARPDTAMWANYRYNGITLFDINTIQDMSYEQFKVIDNDIIKSNIIQTEKMGRQEEKVKLWRKVFDDKL